MALIECHECKNPVSTDAKTCPQCGAKVVIPKIKKPKTRAQKIVLWLGAVAVFAVIATTQNTNNNQAASDADPAKQAQRAAEYKRTVAATRALQSVRNALRNPKTVEWISILTNDEASIICLEYRAQNGFGGYGKEVIAFVDGTARPDAKSWNKYCANKTLHDLTKTAVRLADRI